MSLYARLFDLLLKHGSGGRLLAAGYPDVIILAADLERSLGRSDFSPDPFSDAIVPNARNIVHLAGLDCARDAREVLAAAGYSLDVVDVHADRGCERVVDLNYPIALGEYDVVLDHGTLEHCFNVGQAALNLAGAVAEGGIIVHSLPMNSYNHGFYNFSPTWFYDLYCETAGFELVHLAAHVVDAAPFGLPARFGFYELPENTEVTAVARRVRVVPLAFPLQGAYATSPVEGEPR